MFLCHPQLKKVLWCTWHYMRLHHERRAGRLGCGQPAPRFSCWPTEQARYCRRSGLLAGPHPLPRSPQPASRLLGTAGEILVDQIDQGGVSVNWPVRFLEGRGPQGGRCALFRSGCSVSDISADHPFLDSERVCLCHITVWLLFSDVKAHTHLWESSWTKAFLHLLLHLHHIYNGELFHSIC